MVQIVFFSKIKAVTSNANLAFLIFVGRFSFNDQKSQLIKIVSATLMTNDPNDRASLIAREPYSCLCYIADCSHCMVSQNIPNHHFSSRHSYCSHLTDARAVSRAEPKIERFVVQWKVGWNNQVKANTFFRWQSQISMQCYKSHS